MPMGHFAFLYGCQKKSKLIESYSSHIVSTINVTNANRLLSVSV